MKNHISVFTILFLTISIGTHAQNVDELERRNGFKDLQLASSISNYEGLEFLEEVDDEKYGKLQVYGRMKEHYTSIGTIEIEDLKVKVYNGDIYEIQVIIPKNPKMYGGLKKAFGTPKFDIVTNDYYWQAPSVKLIYRAYNKNSLEMIYHSKVVDRRLEAEKDDEIEDIASDF